jgi:hypothetical protein
MNLGSAPCYFIQASMLNTIIDRVRVKCQIRKVINDRTWPLAAISGVENYV